MVHDHLCLLCRFMLCWRLLAAAVWDRTELSLSACGHGPVRRRYRGVPKPCRSVEGWGGGKFDMPRSGHAGYPKYGRGGWRLALRIELGTVLLFPRPVRLLEPL